MAGGTEVESGSFIWGLDYNFTNYNFNKNNGFQQTHWYSPFRQDILLTHQGFYQSIVGEIVSNPHLDHAALVHLCIYVLYNNDNDNNDNYNDNSNNDNNDNDNDNDNDDTNNSKYDFYLSIV